MDILSQFFDVQLAFIYFKWRTEYLYKVSGKSIVFRVFALRMNKCARVGSRKCIYKINMENNRFNFHIRIKLLFIVHTS